MTPQNKRSTGRPDYPSEAARRAAVTAENALTEARAYLLEPKGKDHGKDMSHHIEALDVVLDELAAMREELVLVKATDPTPSHFFDVMEHVDQAFVDLITTTFIEDYNPILHSPQTEVRIMVGQAREVIWPE